MISVIVPIYNAEKCIRRCVDSILDQNYSDIEILLIDDGSKDNGGAICDAYAVKDSRVRVFHKENGGVSSARNFGIESAIGEWIIFIDSVWRLIRRSSVTATSRISSSNPDTLCSISSATSSKSESNSLCESS